MSDLRAIHQIVPTLSSGDAVGAHTLRVRDALRGAGLESEIFAPDIDPALAGEARPLATLPHPAPERMALLYQCSIGNEVVDLLLRRPDPLVVNYHNLTPVGQLLRWAPEMAHLVGWGRNQLGALARRAVLGIGDSSLNSAELVAAGFARVRTVPVLLDLTAECTPDEPGHRWLFVGRIVPNKAQHDVIAAFAWHRAVHAPTATLRLVGKDAVPAYRVELERMVDELGLTDSVTLTGPVSEAALEEEFRRASVFVCLSDHEGFGIPLLEAMAHGVPVVAFAAAAVPETVGAAGLLLPSKEPSLVAAAAKRAVDDAPLRSHLRAAGRARAELLDAARTGPRFLDALREVLPVPRPREVPSTDLEPDAASGQREPTSTIERP